MIWWEALIPAVVGAIVIRATAYLSPKYFSWVELWSDVNDENDETKLIRRKSILARCSVCFVVTLITHLLWQREMSFWSAATVGFLTAALLLWPMVFHGLPYGILATDWLLIPVYLSFCCLLALSSMFGWGLGQLLLEADEPVKFILMSGGELVGGLILVSVVFRTYTWSSSVLGKERSTRMNGSDHMDDKEES